MVALPGKVMAHLGPIREIQGGGIGRETDESSPPLLLKLPGHFQASTFAEGPLEPLPIVDAI